MTTDSEIIKAEIQRFLEGEYIMMNPCEMDLNFRDVKFGANWILEGTAIQGVFLSRLY